MSGGQYDTRELIRIQNVQQQFKVGNNTVPVLKSVNFSILANSFTLIFGSSGSGKSTLLNTLTGLQAPSSGSVFIEDRDMYAMDPDELAFFRASRIGFVHQTNHWIKSLNVIENVSIPLYFLGFSRAKAEKMAMIALDRVDMAAHATSNPVTLSGGEQQRISMARALANDPLYIIADEPTGNLDSVNGDHIMKLLLNCQTEFRRTIILVTHNMEYISLADHILQMQDGVLTDVPSGDTQKITEALLQDIGSRINELGDMKRHATTIS